MANISYSGFSQFNERILKLELDVKNHKTVDSMLRAGAEIVEPKMKDNLKAVIGKNLAYPLPVRSTGELVSSVGTSKIKTRKSNKARNVKIGFHEPRSVQPKTVLDANGKATRKRAKNRFQRRKGEISYFTLTNAMIANVIEYGKIPRYVAKDGVKRPVQPPKPFVRPTAVQCSNDVVSAMRRELNAGIREAGLNV